MTDPFRKWNQRLVEAVDLLFNANLITDLQHQNMLKKIRTYELRTKIMAADVKQEKA